MTHKILHIIAVLFTALAAALILPRFCKNNRSYFSHLYSEAVYSEILQDFILSHYEYTRENGQIKAFTAYRDTRGNAIDYKALDSLCPLNNAAQLAFENRFPDRKLHPERQKKLFSVIASPHLRSITDSMTS